MELELNNLKLNLVTVDRDSSFFPWNPCASYESHKAALYRNNSPKPDVKKSTIIHVRHELHMLRMCVTNYTFWVCVIFESWSNFTSQQQSQTKFMCHELYRCVTNCTYASYKSHEAALHLNNSHKPDSCVTNYICSLQTVHVRYMRVAKRLYISTTVTNYLYASRTKHKKPSYPHALVSNKYTPPIWIGDSSSPHSHCMAVRGTSRTKSMRELCIYSRQLFYMLCYSVLQCVAMCCGVLQCVAVV